MYVFNGLHRSYVMLMYEKEPVIMGKKLSSRFYKSLLKKTSQLHTNFLIEIFLAYLIPCKTLLCNTNVNLILFLTIIQNSKFLHIDIIFYIYRTHIILTSSLLLFFVFIIITLIDIICYILQE